MKELKLRGYVTPEDFEGSDAERIQKALDLAKSEDIARVVLHGTYKADKRIIIPDGMHFVFEDAVLYGDLQNDIISNFSFDSNRIYIEGRNGKIVGDLRFCNTDHVVIENIEIDGDLMLGVSRNFRIEYVNLSGALTLGRGTQNAIIQHVKCQKVLMLGEDKGYDVPGRERIFKNIILRDSEIAEGARLEAASDCGFLNVQINDVHCEKSGVVLGVDGVTLPDELYKNLTFTDIDAPEPVVFHNGYLHAYVK